MIQKGKLIVFEGASDGIGKSTQIELLRKRLESEGNVVVNYHFPSYVWNLSWGFSRRIFKWKFRFN